MAPTPLMILNKMPHLSTSFSPPKRLSVGFLTTVFGLSCILLCLNSPTPAQPPSYKRIHWNMFEFESGTLQRWLTSPSVSVSKEEKPHISQWEQSLYGKEYPEDSLNKRFDRLEKSLFKQTFHQYTSSQRFARLNSKMMGHQKQFHEPIDQTPAFRYMEKRLIIDRGQAVPARLSAMEEAVYGKEKTGLSQQERFEQLVYDLPIQLQSTPATKSTQPTVLEPIEFIAPTPSQINTSSNTSHKPPMATLPTIQKPPSQNTPAVALPATLSREFSKTIVEVNTSPQSRKQAHTNHTPIRIFIQGETLQQYWWSHQAMAFWNNQHRVFQVVPTAHMAQLVLNWHNNSPALLSHQTSQNAPVPSSTFTSTSTSASTHITKQIKNTHCPPIQRHSLQSGSQEKQTDTACLREILGEVVLQKLY